MVRPLAAVKSGKKRGRTHGSEIPTPRIRHAKPSGSRPSAKVARSDAKRVFQPDGLEVRELSCHTLLVLCIDTYTSQPSRRSII